MSGIEAWLVEGFLSGGKALASYETFNTFDGKFKAEEDVLKYFGFANRDEFTHVLGRYRVPKPKVKSFWSRLRRLGIDEQYFTTAIFSYFNGKDVSETDAETLACLLINTLNCGSTITIPKTENHVTNRDPMVEFFSNLTFGYIPEDKLYPNTIGPDFAEASKSTSRSEKAFAEELFDELPIEEVEWFYRKLRHPKVKVFDRFAPWILNAAIKYNLYQFQQEDITTFKENGITLDDCGDIEFGLDESHGSCVIETIQSLINLIEEDSISLVDCKSFLKSGWGSDCRSLIESYPALNKCKLMVAAAALEGLQTQNSIGFTSIVASMYSRHDPVKIPTAFECLDDYPQEIRKSVLLTCICDDINEHDISGVKVRGDALISKLDSFDEQADLAVEGVRNLLQFLMGQAKSFENRNEIVLAYLLSSINLPAHDYFRFSLVESYDWWDHGGKEVPNSLEFKSKQWLKDDLVKKDYVDYLRILKAAYRDGFYRLIAEQSVAIAKASRVVWCLGEIHDLWLSAMNELDDNQLQHLDVENKQAAFFLSSILNLELAKRLLVTLPNFEFKALGEMENSGYSIDYNRVITDNFDLWCRTLSMSEVGEYQNVFDIFADTIGRQQRKVAPDTVLMSSCVVKAIRSGALTLNASHTDYILGAEVEEEVVGTRWPRTERHEMIQRFFHEHYPRLKAGWAMMQIDFMVKHLESKGLLFAAIENSKGEGIFIADQTLCVIGEFEWSNVFAHVPAFLAGDINKVSVFSVIGTGESQITVNESNFFFDEKSIAIIQLCYTAITIGDSTLRELMHGTVPKTIFRKAFERILPEINFEGVVLNSNC